MPDKVAVIGAGALGLMCMKTFKEDGFDVTGFDTREYIGGLWKDSYDSTISVHPTTIFNSSKYRAAISDFPFPDDADDFPTAAQLHKYLLSYADKFGVTPLVQLGTRVKSIKRDGSRWALEVESKKTGQTRTEYFDRVSIATGNFYTPRYPVLEGLEKFDGRVMHSIEFHGSKPFTDQNVLLIGMHATAQDVTNSLAETAKHVYMAHRSGILLLPRYANNGVPFDITMGTRFIFFQAFLLTWFPSLFYWLFDIFATRVSRSTFPNVKKSWNLSPAPSLAVSTPLIANILYPLMDSGFAEPVCAVRRIIGPKEIELTDGRVLSDVDSIIYCTGYHSNLPDDLIAAISKPESSVEVEAERTGQLDTFHPYPYGADSLGAVPRLYRGIFPLHPDPAVRNSIAVVGQCAIAYPGLVQFELPAMAISQVWLGNSSLPPHEEMMAWWDRHQKWIMDTIKKYKPKENSTFYSFMMPFHEQLPWLDETAGTGIFANLQAHWFNWRSWKLWFQDREAYNLCLNAVPSPMVFRLFDMGKRKAMNREEWKQKMRKEDQNAKDSRASKLREFEEDKRQKKEAKVNGVHANGSAVKLP